MKYELNGDKDITIYNLYCFGGPDDGCVMNAIKPYHEIVTALGHTYSVKEENYLQCIDDFTYRIDLYYESNNI